MADNEKGNEWEVVSLTASAYAASPGPNPLHPPIESKEEEDNDELVASSTILTSHHFQFPPYEPKNLMLEPDCSEVVHNVYPSEEKHNEAIYKCDESNEKLKSDDGIEFFDDKGKNLSDHGMGFGEGKKSLEGLSVVGEEGIYIDPGFSEFPAKTADMSQPVLYDESADIDEPNIPLNVIKANEENKPEECELPPSGAWWKRHAMSLYKHAKESNPLWSVFVAAAMMGFVLLGQRWHREKLQLQQHYKWLTVSDESLSRMVGPFNRFKDILVGNHPQSLLIHGAGVSNHQGI